MAQRDLISCNLGGQDHNLLIKIDTRLEILAEDIKKINQINGTLDARLRLAEDNLIRLSPIPTVSHEEVVTRITALRNKVDILEDNKNQMIGGWKLVLFAVGSIGGIISFILTIWGILFNLLRIKL